MALVNYDIDFKKMVSQLLGSLHRVTIRIAWLTDSLKPVRDIHDQFIAFFTEKKYEVKWSGQTIVLENLLIEKFGAGIYITNNAQSSDELFIGDDYDIVGYFGDNPDVGNFIDDESAIQVSSFDFTVNVPGAIVFVEAEMIAQINKYKLYGKTFNIVII